MPPIFHVEIIPVKTLLFSACTFSKSMLNPLKISQ
ncbi:hypothetical protein NIES2135_12910 [Leptolyngbya boryana NIES-2135]|uniref:Uncharacterized protein n=1 Tax=Leptolyngbya boryana NIES-2135 TaxID=1973484 RepID=A0A1Z4JCG1_LEPBY|nr:hypothetical protein NIES2135_12910 [Leptolyngbya boryana NIES-2135]